MTRILQMCGHRNHTDILRLCGRSIQDFLEGVPTLGVANLFLPPANEVWGKVICLQACVCPQGGSAWSGGRMHGPGGGCMVLGGAWSGGGAWSRGVAWSGGGVAWSRGCMVRGGGVPGGDPPRWLLLWAVHILLECILFGIIFADDCMKMKKIGLRGDIRPSHP